MALISRSADGGVTMTLTETQAAYTLACLGASSRMLFPNSLDGDSLYGDLRDTLGIPPVTEVPDEQATPVTLLFRRFSEALDAWCGKRNYPAARAVAEEHGL